MVAYQTLALAKHTILSVVQHTHSIPDDEDYGGGSDNDRCDGNYGGNFFSRLISDQLTMLAPFLILVSALTAEAADTLKGDQHHYYQHHHRPLHGDYLKFNQQHHCH